MSDAGLVELPWKSEKPAVAGIYLYYMLGLPETVELIRVTIGNWRHAQNPEWLYVSKDKTIDDLPSGWWCGPIKLTN